MKQKIVYSALFGVAVGDALGVPVEFKSREYLKQNPITDMIGFGSHNQPAGTWSDDSSLTFCLAESLCKGFNIQDIANRFIKWYKYGRWTPYGKVFDIGIATSKAISRLYQGTNPLLTGGSEEKDNGNGSLMRILPLVFYVKDLEIGERFQYVKEISSITHRHIRSVLACFIYIEYALQLMEGKDKYQAFKETGRIVNDFLNSNLICSQKEEDEFYRVLSYSENDRNEIFLAECNEQEIKSSGYVLDSLEAAFWCLLKADTYEETVLKAVNLGEDTDTTAAISGGLAGLLYGFEAIPQQWINQLARKEDIMNLCDRLERKLI